ncbi:MAG: SIR2 family NAD-dependent protein deacylase [Saprospiraceae bacterium]
MKTKKKIVVLTGAGISAESGISTFRDANGLWENHSIEDVASPEGWKRNPSLVLEFYNQRRRQLFTVKPNMGHLTLVDLETAYDVTIVTQNVDDLHERAGSSNVLHLHGSLLSACSERNKNLRCHWDKDIIVGDLAADGAQLRPDIVWFGEAVPNIDKAADLVGNADFVIVIGSSMQVYPAAGLVAYADVHVPVWYVDPKPAINYELRRRANLTIIEQSAALGVPLLVRELLEQG